MTDSVITTEVKVVESNSAEGLTEEINKHLSLDYQIVGNNFQVVGRPEFRYSLLMVRTTTSVDPEIVEIYKDE